MKYGFTVSAVVLAVGTTIEVIVSALIRSLKSVAKGFENGFKTLGSKITGIVPGFIGSIISFIFKTAGSGKCLVRLQDQAGLLPQW